jgi:hypothetical protein
MLKIQKLPVNTNLQSQRMCTLNIEGERLIKNIIISLNDSLISAGSLSDFETKSFDCNLLGNTKNTFKIYYLNPVDKKPLGISKLNILNENSKIIDIPFLEYLSTDKVRHIVTIGTIGGNP